MQQAVVDGRVSYLTPVISGVHQGTDLGQVLFLIHIRDITVCLKNRTSEMFFLSDMANNGGYDKKCLFLIKRKVDRKKKGIGLIYSEKRIIVWDIDTFKDKV